MYKVGFTGTQHGMTEYQRGELMAYLSLMVQRHGVLEVHHGDCVGADAEVDAICREFYPEIRVVLHPPVLTLRRAFCWAPAEYIREAKPYLVRDREIAEEVDELVAAPRVVREVRRSGTWATVRYARAAGKAVTILPPGPEAYTP